MYRRWSRLRRDYRKSLIKKDKKEARAKSNADKLKLCDSATLRENRLVIFRLGAGNLLYAFIFHGERRRKKITAFTRLAAWQVRARVLG